MSFGPLGSWIVLDGARLPAPLARPDAPLQRAGGVLQAAIHLARRPALLVADPAVGWHATFLRTLPRQGRPPLLAVSERPPAAGLADAWLRPDASEEECHAALRRLDSAVRPPRSFLPRQTAQTTA